MVWWMAFVVTGALAQTASAPRRPGADTEQIDVHVVDESWVVPDDFTVRVRLTRITPDEPTAIRWRRKGEGMGGEVLRGAFSEEKLPIGRWSPAVPVNAFAPRGGFPAKLFLTITAGHAGRTVREPDGRRVKRDYATGAQFEVEFRWGGRAVKTVREAGPGGGTVGVVVPAYRLAGGKRPDDPAFLAELTGILAYATARAERLEKLPWASWPRPRKYAVINNIGGYGTGSGYGVRHTNKRIVEAECRSLRQLGVNGFRGGPAFLFEMIRTREGFARDFDRACIAPSMGYPVPTYRAGRSNDPECGCPYAPGVAARTTEGVAAALTLLDLPVAEVWGLTVDEIGTVIDRSAEGKGHLAVCPRCAEGFRSYLKARGLRPADFGKPRWEHVAPAHIWRPREVKVPAAPRSPTDPFRAADGPGARGEASPSERKDTFTPPDLADPRQALLAYYTLRFNNHLSARLFTPLRDAFAAANRESERAGKRPRVYSYALRGNTFLMRGHSLDFFDFYRLADNAFVYETSNRDARIWSWDAYLCDVGRGVSRALGKRFGVYVKPHRGAPLQRMLAAVSRGAKMIYWYTYGPDYHKGDSFSQNWETLALTAKAAALLGKAEDVLYGSRWLHPARVAIVKPRTSELWMRLDPRPARDAAWENAKWVYTALQHAHVPVDALDEEMLAAGDLSAYDVIYVNGPNVTRAAAGKLAGWVAAGGTLWTSGGGLARDEANRPLAELAGVLGLRERVPPEMYYRVSLYGAGRIEAYTDARRRIAAAGDGARVLAAPNVAPAFSPIVGREPLRPAADTEVLAKFADGAAAVTCRRHGKGRAYVVGLFPGLEYSAAVRHDRFHMAREFDPALRRLVAGCARQRVRPVVDASAATVEGVLLVHDRTGRRAVTLANWAYRVTAHRKRGRRVSVVTGIVPARDLRITLRGAGKTRKVTSLMLDRPLDLTVRADEITVTLPRLDEGDVLLLE